MRRCPVPACTLPAKPPPPPARLRVGRDLVAVRLEGGVGVQQVLGDTWNGEGGGHAPRGERAVRLPGCAPEEAGLRSGGRARARLVPRLLLAPRALCPAPPIPAPHPSPRARLTVHPAADHGGQRGEEVEVAVAEGGARDVAVARRLLGDGDWGWAWVGGRKAGGAGVGGGTRGGRAGAMGGGVKGCRPQARARRTHHELGRERELVLQRPRDHGLARRDLLIHSGHWGWVGAGGGVSGAWGVGGVVVAPPHLHPTPTPPHPRLKVSYSGCIRSWQKASGFFGGGGKWGVWGVWGVGWGGVGRDGKRDGGVPRTCSTPSAARHAQPAQRGGGAHRPGPQAPPARGPRARGRRGPRGSGLRGRGWGGGGGGGGGGAGRGPRVGGQGGIPAGGGGLDARAGARPASALRFLRRTDR
jgi:hypothetical protein